MPASLRLIPITEEHFRSSHPLFEDTSTIPIINASRHQSTPVLKLCKAHEDIVEIDGLDALDQGPVICAKEYEDGTLASVAVLGRGHFTGIYSTKISRAICDVSLMFSREVSACITMRKGNGEHFLHLDGKLVKEQVGIDVPIVDGSIISLHGASFAYQVEISDINDGPDIPQVVAKKKNNVNKTNVNKSNEDKLDSLITVQESIQRGAKKQIEERSTCALCLEIMVLATFSYPCIHHFCFSCTRDLRSSTVHPRCPICRSKVANWMPGRDIDDIIWASSLLLGCFDTEYARTYLKRREAVTGISPSEEERKLVMNMSCRLEEGTQT